jgi:hypothetical protein
MLVYLSAWVNTHAKLLTVVGAAMGTVAGGVVGIHEYVTGVDDRITLIEQGDIVRQTQLDLIARDVAIVRCMVVQEAQQEDPLGCLALDY